jgi:hypothetical protein
METTFSSQGRKKEPWTRHISWGRVILVIVAVFILYAGVDLFWPFHRDLRQFDPKETAALETRMWRSYYDHASAQLFLELAELLRSQFHFPLLRSYRTAYFAARAAFIFKDGHSRADYAQALPSLDSYFGAIGSIGNISFNVQRVAQLELEWWIVHRDRNDYPPGALQQACAEAAAALYQVPVDSTMEHGRLRAAAMIIRDARAASGEVTDKDWLLIESLLEGSYESLHRVVSHAEDEGDS